MVHLTMKLWKNNKLIKEYQNWNKSPTFFSAIEGLVEEQKDFLKTKDKIILVIESA